MTPSTHSPTRQINHESAIADAEDDFAIECHMFGDSDQEFIKDDLVELKAVAVLVRAFDRDMAAIFKRMKYAAAETKHGLLAYQLDLIDDQLDHGGGNVVRAHVKKMEIEK